VEIVDESGIFHKETVNACTECETQNVTCMLIAYGDGKLDADGYENCDDGNTADGDGCSSKGEIEPGYICPKPGKRCIAAACGDSIVAYGELCDDGNAVDGDGCSSRCKLEAGYACPTAGKACHKSVCGDSKVEGYEVCDDGNTSDGDGCTADCLNFEAGFRCNAVGGACEKTKCGDGKMNGDDNAFAGYETCDMGSANGTDAACGTDCTVNPGWLCTDYTDVSTCSKGCCGDGILQQGEECDDGNNFAGDGCDPKCRSEKIFECLDGVCKPICGDGITLWMDSIPKEYREECDDGNLISGDGCSSDCKVEEGYTCTEFSTNYPDTIELPITYYDFRRFTQIYNSADYSAYDGFVTQKTIDAWIAEDPECASLVTGKLLPDRGHPDFQQDFATAYSCKGMVQPELDSDGKPVFTSANNLCTGKEYKIGTHMRCGATFKMWFRESFNPVDDTHSIPTRINQVIKSTLLLEHKTGPDYPEGTYIFDSHEPPADAKRADGKPMSLCNGYFGPLDDYGYGNTYTPSGSPEPVHNGNFGTEVETYFQYKGGETLEFRGNDDVWVFVNNHLFVDLGGIQWSISGSNTMGSENYVVQCNGKKTDTGKKFDEALDIYENGIYPIKLFQAERDDSGSDYKLTLSGFLNTGKATCQKACGDGKIAGDEECDNGAANDDNLYNGCTTECKRGPYCGDGKINGTEECDEGSNNGKSKCTTDCKKTVN
ncbi:MAG: DUF4215 domain-containing protein, partial [Proteobacteria bacterium]|nr:DUF4215 domain-containing protein [Pseudomonadota bacterium]